jgi:hypothetical protein
MPRSLLQADIRDSHGSNPNNMKVSRCHGVCTYSHGWRWTEVNPCRRSGRSSPAAIATVIIAASTAYLPFLRAGEESSKRGNGDFELDGERRGVEIEGRSRREVTKSSRPLFRLRAGARAISMVAAARAGVDRYWLTGARDKGGSEVTTDSSLSPEPVWRVLTCVRAIIWMQPRNPFDDLLAPEGGSTACRLANAS